jgi:hypothetical protein
MEFRDHTVFHTLASAGNKQRQLVFAKPAPHRIGINSDQLSRYAPSRRTAPETTHG